MEKLPEPFPLNQSFRHAEFSVFGVETGSAETTTSLTCQTGFNAWPSVHGVSGPTGSVAVLGVGLGCLEGGAGVTREPAGCHLQDPVPGIRRLAPPPFRSKSVSVSQLR